MKTLTKYTKRQKAIAKQRRLRKQKSIEATRRAITRGLKDKCWVCQTEPSVGKTGVCTSCTLPGLGG